MSRRIYTYRVEDSADVLPSLQPSETLFVITDPDGKEVTYTDDLEWARAYCAAMNDLLEPK